MVLSVDQCDDMRTAPREKCDDVEQQCPDDLRANDRNTDGCFRRGRNKPRVSKLRRMEFAMIFRS